MGIGQRFEKGQVRALREGLGMTPEEFADNIRMAIAAQGLPKIKLSGMTVRRWESGEMRPNVSGIEAISRAFGVKASRFFVDCD